MTIVDVRDTALPRPDWCAAFDRDGFVVLSGVAPPSFVAEARQIIDGSVLGDGAPSPELDELTRHRWLAEVGATALGVEAIGSVGWSFVRVHQPADERSLVPWHQDVQCLGPIVGERFVTLWLPIEVEGDEPVMEVAAAPADRRMFEPTISMRTGYSCMCERDVRLLGATDLVRARPGDLLVLASTTPHRTVPNRTARARWSVDLRVAPLAGPSVPPTDDRQRRAGCREPG